MKNLKYMSLVWALVSSICLCFTSCDKEEDESISVAKPVITLTEVGHDNSKIAHPGHDMHLEASLLAEGIIQRIDVEIHSVAGGEDLLEIAYTDGKYIGVRNAEFHEHLEIPADASLGKYHLHFTVTDGQGQQTMTECEIELVEEDGEDDEDEHEHHHD